MYKIYSTTGLSFTNTFWEQFFLCIFLNKSHRSVEKLDIFLIFPLKCTKLITYSKSQINNAYASYSRQSVDTYVNIHTLLR